MGEYPEELTVADDCDRRMSVGRGVRPLRHLPLILCALLALSLTGCASRTVRSRPIEFPKPPPQASQAQAELTYALHAYYQQWQGVPYRYGGRGASGIDCSSFVRQTLGNIESLELPRTTTAQAQLGHAIDRSDLEPGDLVFFKTGRSAHHVGIYVGAGRFIHASTSQGVTVSNLDNIYWRRHYWQSRRIAASD